MDVNNKLMQQIKTEANRLGFMQIGVSTPDPPRHYHRFQSWIAKGFHGNMTYLQRPDLLEKRKDPRKLLGGAKSIITLAYPYIPIISIGYKGDHHVFGQVASFALLEDYHSILQQKSEQLCGFISTKFQKKLDHKICVDFSPILERGFAVQSGIGWIGKNANLISPDFGSFVLLCEILIDIALPTSDPFEKDFCGKCNRCLDACPTQCIQNNRTIDARHCISYLTIENPVEIPNDLRSKMGNWIFGCDICQLVCPWNQKVIADTLSVNLKSFNPQSNIDLLAEILISEEDYEYKYKRTPIYRAELSFYKRNLVIAMGNSQNPAFLPGLKKIMDDPYLQTYVKWAIERIADSYSDL